MTVPSILETTMAYGETCKYIVANCMSLLNILVINYVHMYAYIQMKINDELCYFNIFGLSNSIVFDVTHHRCVTPIFVFVS